MSHYLVFTIMPEGSVNPRLTVEELLAPYDENVEVEPYATVCEPCSDCNQKGARITTHNPLSKWDWWMIGGRWENHFSKGDVIPVNKAIEELNKDDDEIHGPFALVTPDGQWHAQGRMGWFGTSVDEFDDDEWKTMYTELLNQYPDNTLLVCDLHI